jgi:competence protein ComEA
MISINEADETELTELHGIGETLAALIVEERNQNGRFWYPEDITAVKGIGIKKLNGFLDTINLD